MMQVAVDLHMPVLPLRDHHRGARPGVDQGSDSCHEVVYLSDSMLNFLVFEGVLHGRNMN